MRSEKFEVIYRIFVLKATISRFLRLWDHLENTDSTVMEANERVRTRYQTKTSKFVDLPQR